jgi:hypothetical protein
MLPLLPVKPWALALLLWWLRLPLSLLLLLLQGGWAAPVCRGSAGRDVFEAQAQAAADCVGSNWTPRPALTLQVQEQCLLLLLLPLLLALPLLLLLPLLLPLSLLLLAELQVGLQVQRRAPVGGCRSAPRGKAGQQALRDGRPLRLSPCKLHRSRGLGLGRTQRRVLRTGSNIKQCGNYGHTHTFAPTSVM